MAQAEGGGQQHPIGLYFKIWILLFILSGFSYAVDYFGLQGYLRWFLIIVFMWLKAAFIVAIFMHMRWERMALVSAIIGPPVVLMVLVFFMAVEGDYTEIIRNMSFVQDNSSILEHVGEH